MTTSLGPAARAYDRCPSIAGNSRTVELPSRQLIASSSVPATCLAAGALLTERDGHVVVASYGSVPGEIAVCMKSVGIADRSDYGVFELRGAAALLDRALVARLGDPPLAPGSARRLRNVWFVRVEPRRALLVGPHAALASGPQIGKPRDAAELTHANIGATIAVLNVIGPRAVRLMAAAELPDDLAIGAVGRDPRDAAVIAILRESQRRLLVLVRAPDADAFWARLLAAGEPLGASFVGCDALTLIGAAHAEVS